MIPTDGQVIAVIKMIAPGIEMTNREATNEVVLTGPKIEAKVSYEILVFHGDQRATVILQDMIEEMQGRAIQEFGLREWADKQIKQAEDRARAAEQARIKGILSAYEQQLANHDKMEAAGYFAQAAREIAENRDR